MTITAIIESLSRQANWSNPALNPDLSTNLMGNPDMLIMQHKIKHPGWMSDENRIKAILKAMQEAQHNG